jgi:isopentenyl-diphosphate delta-isomerase
MNAGVEVVLVDENDSPIGVLEKLEAHRQGRLHRAFSVMLYRTNQETHRVDVLLQQRALNKYHGGGLWANTCCSHPLEGEAVQEAAYRRLQEEVFPDVSDIHAFITLNSVGSFIYRAELDHGLIEHEFDHVFVGEFLRQGEKTEQRGRSSAGERYIPSFNPREIASMEWVDLETLIDQLNNPENSQKRYAPWLKEVALKTRTFAK